MVAISEIPKGYKKTDIGIIPIDWLVKRIDDVANIVGGGTPSTFKQQYWDGNINWFTPTEIGNNKYSYESKRKITLSGLENSSANLLPIDTILLTSRATIGETSILKKIGCTNQGFQSLIAKENVDKEFLYYLSLTLKKTLIKYASGSTFLEISPNKIKSIKIPIPHTKEEQTAIATALYGADELINSLEKLIAKKQMIKQGAMQELLKPKEDWIEKTLGELFEITSSKRVFQSDWKSSGVPFYRARELAVLSEIGKVENELFITNEMYESFRRHFGVPQIGDMLVTGVGTLGKVYVVPDEQKFYFKDGNIIWFKIDGKIDSEYLKQLYTTKMIKKQIEDASGKTTVGTYTITGAKKTLIFMPKTKEEQKYISQILSDMDIEIETLEKKLEKYKMLKQGMMQNLLTGKIRLV